MLDIYLVTNDGDSCTDPGTRDSAAAIAFEDYIVLDEMWQRLKDKGVELPYFEDSQLDSTQVVRLAQELRITLARLADLQPLEVLPRLQSFLLCLDRAVGLSCGIQAFCD
jgi:hypothetical protein